MLASALARSSSHSPHDLFLPGWQRSPSGGKLAAVGAAAVLRGSLKAGVLIREPAAAFGFPPSLTDTASHEMTAIKDLDESHCQLIAEETAEAGANLLRPAGLLRALMSPGAHRGLGLGRLGGGDLPGRSIFPLCP